MSGFSTANIGTQYASMTNKDRPATKDLDKQAFLNLLVTQLSNQDPLNPQDDTAFIAQLAQFTSLETLTNINDGITQMNTNHQLDQLSQTAAYIGKEVFATGTQISKSTDSSSVVTISKLEYAIPEDMNAGYINVYDSSNNLVYTETLTARQKGKYTFEWKGKDYNGEVKPDGVYTIGISAQKGEGVPVMVHTEISGKVKSVENFSDGVYLCLEDGRYISLVDLAKITGA